MSDIALLQFICRVCGVTFWSYTECRIKKLWNDHTHSFDTQIVSAYGKFEQEIFNPDNSLTPLVYNKPVPNERKCGKCRRGSQLEEYL